MTAATYLFASVLTLAGLTGPAASAGDPERGEVLYRPCAACHMIGDGAIHRVGPHLNGLLGRVIGGAEGYDYSAILTETAETGEVWEELSLDGFIANPGGYFSGTTMAFRGIRSAEDRADLIAYMVQEGGSAEDPAVATSGPSPEVVAILEIEGDVAYGRFLSSECTACHIGEGGEGIPSIRGLPPGVFISGMADYRSGARQHQVMNTLSARLGDEEIAALAAYFLSENN